MFFCGDVFFELKIRGSGFPKWRVRVYIALPVQCQPVRRVIRRRIRGYDVTATALTLFLKKSKVRLFAQKNLGRNWAVLGPTFERKTFIIGPKGKVVYMMHFIFQFLLIKDS